MTRRACQLLLATLLAMLCLAAPAFAATDTAGATLRNALTATTATTTATATDEPRTLTFTTGEGTVAKMSPTRIKSIAQLDAGTRRALEYRPGSIIGTTFNPARRIWHAYVHLPADTQRLTDIQISDTTGKIVKRWYLAFNAFPPNRTEAQSISIARRDPRAISVGRQFGGLPKLAANARLQDRTTWEVSFWRGSKLLQRVDVSDASGAVTGVYTGPQIAWKMARGDRRAFGDEVNLWYVWWPLFALFALVMIDLTRLRSWLTLDVLVLLSLGISHELFNQGHISASVPLAMPPLVYLLVRASWLFWRGVPPARPRPEPTSRRRWFVLPTWLIVVIAVFAAGGRYGLDGWGGNVIDVGYAGVAGADNIRRGHTPYGNMPENNQHGDTYGPLNYLAYVPAVLIWHSADDLEWGGGMPAARAVSIGSDVLAALALLLIGWRWISRRAAALLLAGWMTCPWTAYALANNSNDLLVAALVLWAIATLPRAWLRGGLIGIAAMVKFVPLVLVAPLAHAGTKDRRVQTLTVMISAGVVVWLSLAGIALFDHGWKPFLHATFGFQYDRESPFSPWGLYHLRGAQIAAQIVLGVGLCVAIVRPRVRDVRQIAAGAAAALLGVEVVLQHWFYLYIPWFFGPLLVVWVAMREMTTGSICSDHD